MVDSLTSAFSEPEDFETALHPEGFLSLLLTAPGRFRARLTRIWLHEIGLSAAEEWLPRVSFVAVPADVVLLMFSNASTPICGGIEMHTGELITACPGAQFHARIGGGCHWGLIRLSANGLTRYSVDLTGAEFSVSPILQRWRPRPAASKRVRSLHTAAIRLAAKCPQALVDADAAHGLEQQLLHAVVDSLASGPSDVVSLAHRRGQDVIARFEEVLRNNDDTRVSMGDICAALQVSER